MKDALLARFTPSLMTPEVLEAIFVQREELTSSIVERIEESVLTKSKHQILLIGPRGIGKTHLVALVYHRLRQDPKLSVKIRFAWLREEEWGITSFLDFLLRTLRAMTSEHPDPRLQAQIDDLHGRPVRSAEEAAIRLLISSLESRTLLLIVENLEDAFVGMGEEGQKQLRGLIQNYSAFCILATSQSLFGGISLRESPFYGFFNIHHLEPLSFEEAGLLVRKLSEFSPEEGLGDFLKTPRGRARLRALHHLAGGIPRVYVIFSQFLTSGDLDRLVPPILNTLDDLTPYYQSRMVWLSPQQRKIVEVLLDLGRAVTVKEIASRCFITHQTASAQLKTLRDKGYVTARPLGRDSYYDLREPLMRLALEVKKHRGEPLKLWVQFLRAFYSHQELTEFGVSAAEDESEYIRAALESVAEEPLDLVSICKGYFEQYMAAGDLPSAEQVSKELYEIDGQTPDWMQTADELRREGRLREAAVAYQQVVDRYEGRQEEESITLVAQALVRKSCVLNHLGRHDEAIAAADDLAERFGKTEQEGLIRHVYRGLINKAKALFDSGQLEKGLEVLDAILQACQRNPRAAVDEPFAKALYNKGIILGRLGHHDDEIALYDRLLERFEDQVGIQVEATVARARVNRAVRLGQTGRLEQEQEIKLLQNVLERYRGRTEAIFDEPILNALFNSGVISKRLGNCAAALGAYDEWIERCRASRSIVPDTRESHVLLGRANALRMLGRHEKAITAYEELIERFGGRTERETLANVAWARFGLALALGRLERHADAIRVYDEIIERHRERPELEFENVVARAQVNKAIRLGHLNRIEEEIALLESVLDHYGHREEPKLQEPIARALLHKAWALRQVARFEEAFVLCCKVLEAYQTWAADALQEMLRLLPHRQVSSEQWQDLINIATTRVGDTKELKIPLRLLESGLAFRETRDQRLLLQLPSEERKLLEEIFGASQSEVESPDRSTQ